MQCTFSNFNCYWVGSFLYLIIPYWSYLNVSTTYTKSYAVLCLSSQVFISIICKFFFVFYENIPIKLSCIIIIKIKESAKCTAQKFFLRYYFSCSVEPPPEAVHSLLRKSSLPFHPFQDCLRVCKTLPSPRLRVMLDIEGPPTFFTIEIIGALLDI
jgi:hypothetical protein